MKEYISNELIENTYLFCIKRISDSEAAKDLAQDILYEALRVIASGKEFVSFYSWYWKMARNKYVDYIACKQNPVLPMEVASDMVAEFIQPIDRLIHTEELSGLHFSLSRLASIHREIIIRFYLKEQSVAQIAEELHIPIGTVKRRLFDAKKNLKERFESMKTIGTSSYAPARTNWIWGFNPGKAWQCMEQTIAQQVCVICRMEAKTINEIADEMGVAPVYLEPILNQMTTLKLLVSHTKGKYLTNFCVFPTQVYKNADAIACNIFRQNDFCKRTSDILLSLKDKITALNFYGNDFDYRYLMWLLYVQAGHCYGETGKKRYIAKYENKYKDEAERRYRITMDFALPEEAINDLMWKDIRAVVWSNLHQDFLTSDYGKITFVNDFDYAPFTYSHGCLEEGNRDVWVNGNNISLLVALAENPHKIRNAYEEEMVAEFIKHGLIEKTEDGLKVQLPILKRSVYAEMYQIIEEALHELVCEYADMIAEKIEPLLLPYVRKDLMSNFIHWDMQIFFQTITYLFYYGMNEADCLAIPEDYNRSAAGLYIFRDSNV